MLQAWQGFSWVCFDFQWRGDSPCSLGSDSSFLVMRLGYHRFNAETLTIICDSTNPMVCRSLALGCWVVVKERNPCLDDLLIIADMKRLNFNCAFQLLYFKFKI